MFEYCSKHAERAYKLLEDGDYDNGMEFLAHLADVLQMLTDSRNSQGTTNITLFAQSIKEFDESGRDQLYSHLQETGFGQYIPE
jgi:flagellin-specific chaperone FliS